jgi:hypothetical protein
VSESVKKTITNNSFNQNPLSSKSKSKKLINRLENRPHHFKKTQSNSSEMDSMSFSSKKVFRKKKNSVLDRNIIKNKFNGLIDRFRTLSTDILKRNKTYVENNEKSKKIIKMSSKSIDLNLKDSQIKKRNSLHYNDDYINFKTDIIKKENKDKPFNLKSLLRRKKNSIKKGKKIKIMLNDSSQNSFISDQSDINLKKSLNQRKSMKNAHLQIKRKLFELSSPRNYIHSKSSIGEKNKSDNILMKAKTIIMKNNDIVKQRKKNIISSLKLDANFIHLKKKLQKTIILRPEDADIFLSEDEKSINNISKSSRSNKNYINKKTNKKASIFKINKLMRDNNNHLMHRKKRSKSNKTLTNYGLKENIFNLKRANTANDANSYVEPSKKERRKRKNYKKRFSAQSKKHSSKKKLQLQNFFIVSKKILYIMKDSEC